MIKKTINVPKGTEVSLGNIDGLVTRIILVNSNSLSSNAAVIDITTPDVTLYSVQLDPKSTKVEKIETILNNEEVKVKSTESISVIFNIIEA